MQIMTSAKIALEGTTHYSSSTEHLKLRSYVLPVTSCYKMFLAQWQFISGKKVNRGITYFLNVDSSEL